MSGRNKTAAAVVSLAMLCCLPAEACGFAFSSTELAVLVGLFALALGLPIAMAAGGLISAVRIRRHGATARRLLAVAMAVLMEGGIGALSGLGSLVGLACLGAVLVQLALVVFAWLDPGPEEPLPGVVTPLADAALFAAVPR